MNTISPNHPSWKTSATSELSIKLHKGFISLQEAITIINDVAYDVDTSLVKDPLHVSKIKGSLQGIVRELERAAKQLDSTELSLKVYSHA